MKNQIDISDDADLLENALGIALVAGWTGAFTRQQADDALPNGTRIKKVIGEPGDTHSLGAKGTILGSIRNPQDPRVGYFVEWDDSPKCATFVIENKIAPT